ncbi:hypothetical protein ACFLVW_02530 [Chloroflexota bacterium]
MEEAIATAKDLAFNPTESLFAVKKLVSENLGQIDIMNVEERERAEFEAARERPEFKEAVNAFLEKRQPNFHKT